MHPKYLLAAFIFWLIWQENKATAIGIATLWLTIERQHDINQHKLENLSRRQQELSSFLHKHPKSKRPPMAWRLN